MKLIVKYIFVFICIYTFSKTVFAQDSTYNYYELFGFRMYAGTIFAHAKDVENTAESSPISYEFEYLRRHHGVNMMKLCRCYPSTGFNIAFKDYDNDILAYGFHAAYFVQYHFFDNKLFNPVIRGTGGFEYNTNPYHPDKNPDNRSYSLPVNAYLQFKAGFNIRLSSQLFMDVALSFNHISNGGIQYPNRGINWPAASMSLSYSPNYIKPDDFSNYKIDYTHEAYNFKRFSAYSSRISKTFNEKERFMIYGAEFDYVRNVSKLNNLMIGAEWNYDMSLKKRIELYEDSDNTANRLSLNLGHEFKLGKFRFNQKLGVYVYDELKLNDLFYHKWGISYVYNDTYGLGVFVKAHKHVAEFTAVKLFYNLK